VTTRSTCILSGKLILAFFRASSRALVRSVRRLCDAGLTYRISATASRIRYGRLQRFNVITFYLAFIGVFGGLAIGCSGLETLGGVAMGTGFALIGVLVAESYVIIPSLKCPSCRRPFFVPKGWIGLLNKINPHNRRCVNCGMNIDQPNKPEDAM
jgi:hypothetical protein